MSRYDTIPKAWWQWMGTGFKLLDQDLAAIEDNTAAGTGPNMLDRLVTESATRINASGKDVSGGGYQPTLEPGQIIKTGTSAGAASYRSEVTLPTSAYIRATEGWTIDTSFDLNLSGAFATQPTNSWNVVYQIHGRLNSQVWPPPPVELNFQAGTYRVSNSSTAPNADGQLIPSFSESMPRIRIANPVGAWHTWRIRTVLGGAGRGFVNAWCDGEQVVTDWFPIAGTFYSHPNALDGTPSPHGHEWVYTKIGLYGGGSHTSDRVVQHRNVVHTVADVNNVTRYVMA